MIDDDLMTKVQPPYPFVVPENMTMCFDDSADASKFVTTINHALLTGFDKPDDEQGAELLKGAAEAYRDLSVYATEALSLAMAIGQDNLVVGQDNKQVDELCFFLSELIEGFSTSKVQCMKKTLEVVNR